MTDTIDPVAAFLAKGGTITKVRTGAAAIDGRDWKHLVRGNAPEHSMDVRPGAAAERDARDEQQSEIEREAVFEAGLMGGHEAAIEELNYQRMGTRSRKRGTGRRDMEAQRRYNEEWGVNY